LPISFPVFSDLVHRLSFKGRGEIAWGTKCVPHIPSSETQGLLVGTMRYFRASDIFGAKVLFQGLKSPWALFLTKRVPEVSKSVPLIEKYRIVPTRSPWAPRMLASRLVIFLWQTTRMSEDKLQPLETVCKVIWEYLN